MKPLVLTLRSPPDQRVDLSPISSRHLSGKTVAEIAGIAVQTTRERLTVGDLFRIRVGDPRQIRIEGGSERFDLVGKGMAGGELVVEGDVGCQAGRLMTAGRLVVKGRAGPWAASGLRGGLVEITGSAGDRLGGPLPGEMAGMRGGMVVVRGDGGDRVGDRLRRGTIIIEGHAGAAAGSRMIAGTLIVRQAVGPLPGYLMRRGTIVIGAACETLPPTFVDCGIHDLVAMRLLTGFVGHASPRATAVLRRPLRRLAGDMSVLGKGELFCPAA